jgi:hypothetical protein
MTSPKFPIVVKQGSVAVKIYRKPSRGCESYTLSYYQDGVRKRPAFALLQTAREEAAVIANRLGIFLESSEHKRRLDSSGTNTIEPNAGVRMVERERFRQPDDGEFRRRVSDHERRGAFLFGPAD